jgi:hypothetical protein
MADVRHGVMSYPGVVALESGTYTVSHGISPGVACLKVQPQVGLPAQHGDLVITDGVDTVTVPGCRLNGLKVGMDDRGAFWSLEIVDRRWRWRELGAIFGAYNQLDPHGKLIPWTIRSPTELAALCLEAMGETNFTLNLPPGLSNPGHATTAPVPNVSGVNPPINWEGLPPAVALQQVAELFGCRVIYQLQTDTVLVAPVGTGASLPTGGVSIHRAGPSLKSPETPDAVGVIGSPTRYQMRLALEAVGEEWDGRILPIDQLSYAPQSPGTRQQVRFRLSWGPGLVGPLTPNDFVLNIFLTDANGNPPGGELANYRPVGTTPAQAAATLAARINLGPARRAQVTATSSGADVIVTANRPGVRFGYGSTLTGGGPANPRITQSLVQTARAAGPGWSHAPPPLFGGTGLPGGPQATDRLSAQAALRLAQKCIWRMYRVKNEDASGEGAIKVPGYGEILRREQLVLQDTQVDQVVPLPPNPNIVNPATREQFLADYYNGFSRDRAAVVYGAVVRQGLPWWFTNRRNSLNTAATDQVVVPFTVDPLWQMIVFSEPVYRYGADGSFLEPELTLQTAVLVRNLDTNQLERFVKVAPLGGTAMTNPKMQVCPDVQLEITSTYDPNENTIQSVSVLDRDPLVRADYYLRGLASQYNLSKGATVEYNGIVPVGLDGAIQQVTWSVGPQGATTQASRNTEHSLWVPPYPDRRRAEYLPAAGGPPAGGGGAGAAQQGGGPDPRWARGWWDPRF